MAKFIELNKIVSETARHYNDGLGGDSSVTEPTVVSQKEGVNVDLIRSFGPRKDNKPGTLLIFTNASMFSVTETYDEVKRAVTLPPSKQKGMSTSTNAADVE